MDLLHHGVDRAAITRWLGHESVATAQIYIRRCAADMRVAEVWIGVSLDELLRMKPSAED